MLVFEPVKKGICPVVVNNAIRVVETAKYYRVYFAVSGNILSASTIINKAEYILQVVKKEYNVEA